jgi:hypothetical protein
MLAENWRYLPIVTVGCFAGFVGLSIPGCESWANSKAQLPNMKTQGETVQVKQARNTPHPQRQDAQTSDRSSLEQLGLQEGMRYQEARKLLTQKGWQPHEEGESPNLQNTPVKALFDLGYKEVKDCSGTGLGLCRFEFTQPTGERLVISTTTANSDNGDPLLWRWFIENNLNTAQQSSSPLDDQQFIEQDFSQALLKQILQTDRGCFDFDTACSYRKFTFRDAVLIAEPYDSGEVRNISLIPHQSIPQEQALSYARVLDDHGDVNFGHSQTYDSETVSYGGKCLDHSSDEDISATCYVRLHLTPNGDAAKIELVHSSD